jgi:transcriptional regulator with XRE-family HTH domain
MVLTEAEGDSAMDKSLKPNNLASAPFAVQVATLRSLFGFTQSEFAQILGVDEKTIRRWESDTTERTPHKRNEKTIEALRTIAEALGDLFEPDVIKVWVDRENPALSGERPRDFAKKSGGIFLMAHLLGTLGR